MRLTQAQLDNHTLHSVTLSLDASEDSIDIDMSYDQALDLAIQLYEYLVGVDEATAVLARAQETDTLEQPD